ncbi:MAG: hypothetical protein KH231_06070 [Dialister sp.]|nr:hypothetical protein [Dialister sp.]
MSYLFYITVIVQVCYKCHQFIKPHPRFLFYFSGDRRQKRSCKWYVVIRVLVHTIHNSNFSVI